MEKSPNGRILNEIDHILINDASIIKDVKIISHNQFQSDHRIVICQVKIERKIRYKNLYKNRSNKSVFIIPLHKSLEANEKLKSKLGEYWNKNSEEGNPQEIYDRIEKAIMEINRELGNHKHKI